MEKRKSIKITEQMAPITFAFAIIYWILDSIMSLFTSYDNIFEQLIGRELDEVWMRIIVMALFAIFGSHAQYTINERKKAEKKLEKDAATRERFHRLLSPNLAEMVVSGELDVEKGGEDRIATVLFVDIRGFTALSESTKASEVLKILNEYYEVVVDVVFKREGTVDKFIGDEMMVIWGAPLTNDDDPLRAVKSALDILKSLVIFNESGKKSERPEIKVGIGINTGRLTAGYIGSSRTMSYSVIGDTVNTASRLCSAARPGQILISENTCSHVSEYVYATKLEPIKVKGKLEPVPVYAVEGVR